MALQRQKQALFRKFDTITRDASLSQTCRGLSRNRVLWPNLSKVIDCNTDTNQWRVQTATVRVLLRSQTLAKPARGHNYCTPALFGGYSIPTGVNVLIDIFVSEYCSVFRKSTVWSASIISYFSYMAGTRQVANHLRYATREWCNWYWTSQFKHLSSTKSGNLGRALQMARALPETAVRVSRSSRLSLFVEHTILCRVSRHYSMIPPTSHIWSPWWFLVKARFFRLSKGGTPGPNERDWTGSLLNFCVSSIDATRLFLFVISRQKINICEYSARHIFA